HPGTPMMRILSRALAAALLAGCALSSWAAATPPIAPESRLVAASGAPAPTSQSFTIASAEDLTVTLTDLKVPAALASATVAVTQGDALVGSASYSAPATSATFSISKASGAYTLWVFGTPNAAFSAGTFTACVAPTSTPSACIQSASLVGIVSAPGSASNPAVSTLSTTLTVTTAGAYTFNFTDFQFPAALATPPDLALFQGSNTVQLSIASGTAITLSPGTYTLLGIAQANATTQAGLYGLTVTSPGGAAALLNITVPVGVTQPVTSFNNPSTESVTLKITDFAFPGALASASALLTAGGTAIAQASAAGGAMTQSAPAGALDLWIYANAGGTPGTYEADVSAGATHLYTTAGGATPSGSTTFAYGFVSPSVTAGSYQATLADLQFPSALSGVSFDVAQNGSILKSSNAAGTVGITAAAGPVVFLVSAQTPPAGSTSTNGLFEVDLQTSGASPQLEFDKTQSVSSTPALFDSQTLTIGVSASFDATLADLKVPAAFDSLALVVSQGSTVFGKIYGGGMFSFDAVPGTYQLTFVASPASQQQYGLYGTAVVFTPPTITTFKASATSAATNTAITLTWATANATSCTGSGGGWNGSTTSGSASVVLAATTTYTLSCTGAGGTASQSVQVTATAAASSSGGGGSLDPGLLAVIALIAGFGHRMRRGASA
ncbi:MAG TPA: hypothetical protein VK715_10225, partial [Steroidobacteraceae bacterium]|nr:hypothetical protein [Steroidobacteraceae bacterium]